MLTVVIPSAEIVNDIILFFSIIWIFHNKHV